MEYYHIHDNYIFKIVFLIVTCPEDFYQEYIKKFPLMKSVQERIERGVGKTFEELFDEHYNIWLGELNSTDDFLSYIKKDLLDAEKEI